MYLNFGIEHNFHDEDSGLFFWPVSVLDCIRLTILNMLLYPAMIPAIPNMIKNQGAVSSHSSSQVPIKKPTTTDNPTSNPIELYIIHFGLDLLNRITVS